MIFSKLPFWLTSSVTYVLKKRLYLLVPLGALTVTNYIKDYELKTQRNDSKILSNTINNLIVNQIGSAGIIEQTDLVFWVKELVNDKYVVVYISPAYQGFLPKEINRYDLLGRTASYFDENFGDIYQKNDKIAHGLKEPRIFSEPYKVNGVGPNIMGDFLKGRVKSSNNRVLIFGVFTGKSKKQKTN